METDEDKPPVRWGRRYLLAALPALLTLLVWAVGLTTYYAAGCRTGIKTMTCEDPRAWVWWLAVLGDFWMPVVIWATGSVSFLLLMGVMSAHFRARALDRLG